MISTHQLVSFGITAFIIIVIPGPSVVFVIGRALSYGRGVALASVLGNTLGLVTVALLVSVGLGAIVAESLVVFTALKLLGAAYLVYLGVQAIRHRSAIHADGAATRLPMTNSRAVRQGYVVGISNPKGFMMFAAILPQFVEPGSGHLTAQMLILGMFAVTIGCVSDAVWALLAGGARDWFNASPSRGRAMGLTGGLSMIGLGVALATTGHGLSRTA
ncbi:MAG: LysE family translocator [Nocardioidaceae bacterium]